MAHTEVPKRYSIQLGTAADSSFLPKYAAGWISTMATGSSSHSTDDEDFLRPRQRLAGGSTNAGFLPPSRREGVRGWAIKQPRSAPYSLHEPIARPANVQPPCPPSAKPSHRSGLAAVAAPAQKPAHRPEVSAAGTHWSYIVDFICFDPMLVIEIDGSQHTECMAYVSERSAFLEGKGFNVIRFWNDEVLAQTDGCAKPLGNASRS